MRTVAIIGGGAAGMTAAITAANDPRNNVILYERQQRVGRKLLSTGNGRCNLTNTAASPERYNGGADFVKTALSAYPPARVLEFFRALGLVTAEEYGGRVYPRSDAANSVVDVLRFALQKPSIAVRSACPVTAVRKKGGGFEVVTDEGEDYADFVVVACGGCAGAKVGGVKDGYELLRSLGHRRTGLYPALAPITTEPEYPRALKGVRADAAVWLTGAARGESRGEIQFTEKGVSGPAVFDLCRAVSTAGDGKKTLHINFLRGFARDETEALLNNRRALSPELPAEELFTGVLHNRVGKMAVKYAGVAGTKPMKELTDGEIRAAALAAMDFALPVKGTEGFEQAQVTAGGMDTREFDPATMESRLVPHLYACGEVLDVDGECGGFNLQWAWASGLTAGRLSE